MSHSEDKKEDILSAFSPEDLHEIERSVSFVVHHQKGFKLRWTHIANCVNHEMYPKLGSIILAIINDDSSSIEMYNVDNKYIDSMLQMLKNKRNLAVEERTYLKKLCQRAMKFIPITLSRSEYYINELHRILYPLANGNQDFFSECKELNSNLLQDIFDVHRQFRFSNYHFEEYTIEQFTNDLTKGIGIGTEKDLLKKYVENDEFKARMNFHPCYIINDNMFEIFGHIFNVSSYVDYVRKHVNIFSINIMIIPALVYSVYDEDIVFDYDNHMEDFDDYLGLNNIHNYQRIVFGKDNGNNYILKTIKHLYDLNCIRNQNINNVTVIIRSEE
eukprot:481260_1